MGIGLKLAQLIVPIIAETGEFEAGIGKAQGLVKSFSGNIQTAGKTIVTGLGVGLAAGAAGTAALGGAMLKLASDAAPLVNVRAAFDGIAESAGSSGEIMLAAFDKATAGMVDHESAMMSYNKAAQLVGKEFAGQLPDAMGYLGKVAAATGQDMGFMLDSLVTGVGRLSPMILDNLGIQVALSEATERASEMFGVEASELTKAQQQAGMMNVVLEKLANNTAAMPDITKSAAGQMAALKNQIKNTKDAVGMALVPALGKLLGAFNPLIQKALPVIVSLFENQIGPALEKAGEWVVKFIGFIQDFFAELENTSPLEALRTAILNAFGSDVWSSIEGIIAAIQGFAAQIMTVWSVIQPYIKLAWDWIAQNVQLKDVLIALGIAVASVVVPAIISLVASFAPILLAIGAVIAIVALLRKVWEDHSEAIKIKAQEVWSGVQQFISTAIEVIQTIVQTVLGAIQAFWNEHGAAITAVVESFWGMIQAIYDRVVKIIQGIVELFHSDSESGWSTWSEVIGTIVDVLWSVLSTLFDLGLKNLKTLFDLFAAIFKGDWEEVWEKVKELFGNIWDAIKTIAETVWGEISGAFDSFKTTLEPIATKVKGFFQGIADAIGWISGALETVIGWISSFLTKLAELAAAAIPPWLQGHSPPPMANWLHDIATAASMAAEALGQEMRLAITSGANLSSYINAGSMPNTQYDQSRTVNLTINNPVAESPTGDDYYTALALI